MLDLLERIMDAETSAGFLIILAFVLGAGVQSLSGRNNNGNMGRILALLESVASYLGAEHKRDRPRDSDGNG